MATTVEKTIVVDVPVRVAYDQLTQFEEYPRFVADLEYAQQVSDERVHWAGRIGGVRREWDTVIVEQVPDHKVAWTSTSGSSTEGTVFFDGGDGRTVVRLMVVLEQTGEALAEAERRIVTDLERYKSFVEAGGTEGGWRGTISDTGPGPEVATVAGVSVVDVDRPTADAGRFDHRDPERRAEDAAEPVVADAPVEWGAMALREQADKQLAAGEVEPAGGRYLAAEHATADQTTREHEMDSTTTSQDVIAILLQQHERIKDLFAHVKAADGEHKQHAFDELRALLAAHETAEEMVLRPVTSKLAGHVADARNEEEKEANKVLAELEKMDVSSAEFDRAFAEFELSVLAHATHEERDEFPAVRAAEDGDKLRSMGKALLIAEKMAPSHPHPSTAGSPMAQWAVGPFASLVDKARDAISGAMKDDKG